MPNPVPACGSCGKSVSTSDITCPHCGVLLAAYASPSGSSTTYQYDWSAPLSEAVPEPEMTVPQPAAPIDIPDEVEEVSTAPRPLFDTNLTVEEIVRAAESDHDEPLVIVREEKIATKTASFEVPDYARPRSNAAPVPIIDEGDEEMIARRAETPVVPAIPPSGPARPTRSAAPARPATPPATAEPDSNAESWLYDISRSGPTPGPARPVRERKNRPEPIRTTTLPPKDTRPRGKTDTYLRKLHAEAGYESDADQLSMPVDASSPNAGTGWQPGLSRTKQVESLEKSRKGCSLLLYVVLFFMWISVVTGIVRGDLNSGLLTMAVALSFVARFLNKPLPGTRK